MPSIGKVPPPTNPPAPGTYIRQRRHTVRPNPPPTSAPSKSLNIAAIERALQRVEDGTYGRSVRSGALIPDERLEVEPAAELTVEEAEQEQSSQG